jgi:hypothetical protein
LVQSYKYVNGVSYKYVKGVSYKYIKGVSYKYVNSVCKLQVCKRCKLQIFVITKNSNSPIFVTFVRMGTWSSCTSWWTRTAGSATRRRNSFWRERRTGNGPNFGPLCSTSGRTCRKSGRRPASKSRRSGLRTAKER